MSQDRDPMRDAIALHRARRRTDGVRSNAKVEEHDSSILNGRVGIRTSSADRELWIIYIVA